MLLNAVSMFTATAIAILHCHCCCYCPPHAGTRRCHCRMLSLSPLSHHHLVVIHCCHHLNWFLSSTATAVAAVHCHHQMPMPTVVFCCCQTLMPAITNHPCSCSPHHCLAVVHCHWRRTPLNASTTIKCPHHGRH